MRRLELARARLLQECGDRALHLQTAPTWPQPPRLSVWAATHAGGHRSRPARARGLHRRALLHAPESTAA